MLTFFETVFALGTLWFWLLVLIDFVIITALVENEEGIWASVVTIGSIIGLNYLWKLPVLKSAITNPGHTLLLILAYFVLGATWSVAKWFFFLHKRRIAYEEFKADFLKSNNAAELTPELAKNLMDTLSDKYRYSSDTKNRISPIAPLAREYKSTLTRWATYWPFSIVGTLLNDFVRKLWAYVYELLQSTYQRLSNHVFRNTAKDVELAKLYKAPPAPEPEPETRRRGW